MDDEDKGHAAEVLLLRLGPIRVAGDGILEVLDALGVPHRPGPRQMFKIEVVEGPLPAITGPGILALLEQISKEEKP